MDYFPDGIYVRLRNRAQGTYLHADEDGLGVSLSPRGTGRDGISVVWQVHRVVRDGVEYVLLHSAANGRYLARSPDELALPCCRGKLTFQRRYDDAEQDGVLWRPALLPDGRGYVALGHPLYGTLRPNGRFRVWRNCCLCVGFYGGIRSRSRHWAVEIVPKRAGRPPLPLPHLGQGHNWRRIRYLRSTDPLNFSQPNVQTFFFYGCSVFNLMVRLGMYENKENVLGTIMCVQAGTHGRLTPLITDLPRSNEPMNIVVFTGGPQDTEEIMYPDVEARGL